MTQVLTRRGRKDIEPQALKWDYCIMMEAQIEMLQLQAKECQRISGKTPDARKGQKQTLSYRFQRVHCLAGVLIFILAFKTLWDNKFLLFFSHFSSVQFSSVTQSCPTLWDPMNHSMPALPVHHQLLEFTNTHARRVGDAIQPSHALSSPSPPAPNPSQHEDLFQWVNSLHQVAKVLEFQLQPQSFQWTPRTDLL